MGKKQKKGEKGAAVNYISRTHAVKKLQISLANFRRLCILRGIYPRDPKNKKKVGKGSTAARTYYYRKDIQYLLHEPILATMREEKVWAKKMKRAMIKRESGAIRALEESKPVLVLDHVIKERYPSFVDALRDLDDALSMIFLFATLPADDKIHAAHVATCQTLALQFSNYVALTHSLRKVFLSIKGIYYQAVIAGQTITWIMPYQFSQAIPTDVDFRVMGTFLELYQTLLGFVNYKLYTDLNLVYPPPLNAAKDQGAAGLTALLLQSQAGGDVLLPLEQDQDGIASKTSKKKRSAEQKKRLDALAAQMPSILERAQQAEGSAAGSMDQLQEREESASAEEEGEHIPVPVATPTTPEEMVPQLASLHDEDAQRYGRLFAGYHFFLSREVSRTSLEFVIRSMGGTVGWDASVGAGSPYPEHSPLITHHILDRPILPTGVTTDPRYQRREFLQPQWVYDCVNRCAIVKTDGYHVGETLPPHLSPFVALEEGNYDPMEEEEEEAEGGASAAPVHKASAEEVFAAELEAEREGKAVVDLPPAAVPAAPSTAAPEPTDKELASIMMSKKDRQLYSKIQYGKKKKQAEVDKLREKRKKLAVRPQ